MFGTQQFDAILNLPQVGILAVGAALKRPVVEGDRLEVGTVMTVTLTADHRAVDGAMAAQFLQTLKGLLEEPASMLRLIRLFQDKNPMAYDFDIVVIGGGPAGYAGAIRAAQLKKKRALRRARQARRNLPELGLHPDQGALDQRPPGRADQEPRDRIRLQRTSRPGTSPR